MASGLVVGWNRRSGFIAIHCDDGDITVAELLDGWEPEVGVTRLRGDLHSLGSEPLAVIGTRHTVEVFIQDCHCSVQRARELLQQ